MISAPVMLPPGGMTVTSSFGAEPVTLTLAAAGVRTVVVTNDGALPVTAILAADGVRVVSDDVGLSTRAIADQPIEADCVVLNVVPDVVESETETPA